MSRKNKFFVSPVKNFDVQSGAQLGEGNRNI